MTNFIDVFIFIKYLGSDLRFAWKYLRFEGK